MSVSPQTSIYETTIENPELEAALEARQSVKDKRAKVNSDYKEKDEIVKGKLDELDLGIGAPVRIGRFVISKKSTNGRSVSFETSAGTRHQISLIKDEG